MRNTETTKEAYATAAFYGECPALSEELARRTGYYEHPAHGIYLGNYVTAAEQMDMAEIVALVVA